MGKPNVSAITEKPNSLHDLTNSKSHSAITKFSHANFFFVWRLKARTIFYSYACLIHGIKYMDSTLLCHDYVCEANSRLSRILRFDAALIE